MNRSEMNGTSKVPELSVTCVHHDIYRTIPSSAMHQCPHLQAFKQTTSYHNLSIIHYYLFSLKLKLLDNIPIPSCHTCSEVLGKLRLCTDCIFVGCSPHSQEHSTKKEHNFGIEVASLELFCFQCNDIVYDLNYDSLVCKQFQKMKFVQQQRNSEINLFKMNQWIPTEGELKLLHENSTNQFSNSNNNGNTNNNNKHINQPSPNSQQLVGLRGLVNLGSTCFMNSILQVFLNNPLLRNYFLGEYHNRYSCENEDICLSCEMEYLFSEIYSGTATPLTPANFLFSVWKYAKYFAAYEQQDAHEFLITILNGIHNHSNGTHGDNCKCITHTVFGGILRSDVTCSRCANKSSAYDPFFDISVNIPNYDKEKTTLQECLSRFTQPEKLGEKFQCSVCKGYQECTKQFSIQILPPVLCIHFKRFDHRFANSSSSTKIHSTKVNSLVEFPSELNMQPYTCSETGVSEIYQLFAVVNHHGTMENGHYTAFVRHPTVMWVKCDDAFITKATLPAVMDSQGLDKQYSPKLIHLIKTSKDEMVLKQAKLVLQVLKNNQALPSNVDILTAMEKQINEWIDIYNLDTL